VFEQGDERGEQFRRVGSDVAGVGDREGWKVASMASTSSVPESGQCR
jgi:hypothetical protein